MNLYAPIIVGGVVALLGLAFLIWMNANRPRRSPELERLLEAERSGRTGVDLGKMSDEEIIRRLRSN
jgi:hypothetical protein